MRVAILIDQFTPCVPELRYLWRRWEKRGQLIDWHVARDYFVRTTVFYDDTVSPPIITDRATA